MELSFAWYRAVILVILPTLVCPIQDQDPDRQESIQNVVVQTWAEQLGLELWNFGEYVTRRKEVQESYKTAGVEARKGEKLLEEIAQEIENMMLLKISAVKRIMDAAQNTAQSEQEEEVEEFKYYNAKLLVKPGEAIPEGGHEMTFTPNKHFFNLPVNISYSAVHIPTNVYDGAREVMRAIKWSQNLDSIFTNNYRGDPSLSWQYFGSSTGFMRQYPAIQWKYEPVDLYDCRTRSWYIEAAASPKDIIILVDTSGSMTGMRKEIARHVVHNILDTLGNNDFVNILTFAEDVEEVVSCFKDILVQANLANIRELKTGLEEIETLMIANFSLALTRAFEILQVYRGARLGACCNQAIMLITDGVPYNFKEIFEEFNWRSLQSTGVMPVRVFTYLIGREVADVREVKWMACANQGYYVHLSTLAEVREQVLQYVPVMARPLVLNRSDHPIIWTPVYADITDPKMSDWLWDTKESGEQKENIQKYRKNAKLFATRDERDRRYARKYTHDDSWENLREYKLMTSVSMPVYDLRENATRVANLLGVAGTDVPIREIQRLMNPHRLGVNGYAFLVTNNGYILVHPDLRPAFRGILKPSYNSVDFAEVELVDDNREPRELDPVLTTLRDDLVNQINGSKYLNVKYHYDDMRRVGVVRRHYYYRPVLNFSLAIVIPEPYGMHRIHSELEIHRAHVENMAMGKHKILEFFKGKNWKIHPDWDYCKYHYETDHSFESPEEELYHFLNKTSTGWKWLKRNFPPPEHGGNSSGLPIEKDSYFCDRSLLQSLVMDAKITEWFNNNLSAPSDEGAEYQARYGFCVAFMATHSGLTRWMDFHTNEDDENRDEMHFSEIHNRAIDEIWYKRAVEQYEENNTSFVYSVPHQDESGYKNGTLVTASHAVFHSSSSGDHKHGRAPAAVVGFQVKHSAFHELFTNITSTVSSSNTACKMKKNCKTCNDPEVDCYVLDNHGYVIVSKNLADTGRFFGEVRGFILEALVRENVYRKIRIYDYQAVCFRFNSSPNSGQTITPLRHMQLIFNWLLHTIIYTASQVGLAFSFALDEGNVLYDSPLEPTATNGPDDKANKSPMERMMDKVLIKRTKPQPCDEEVNLFLLNNSSDKGVDLPANGCKRPFAAQSIPHSNLLLLVVDALCPMPERDISLVPQEVGYNSSLSCYKVRVWTMNRKRPRSCYNHHEKEAEIELCGGVAGLASNLFLAAVLVFCSLLQPNVQLVANYFIT